MPLGRSRDYHSKRHRDLRYLLAIPTDPGSRIRVYEQEASSTSQPVRFETTLTALAAQVEAQNLRKSADGDEHEAEPVCGQEQEKGSKPSA
ncbi:MAG: hypothetical protein ABW076_10015 [Candidatus Thiodiazotropha sp.]